MTKCWLNLDLARNLPTCGCKSMLDGPMSMLDVLVILLHTHTMTIICYWSTYKLIYPPSMVINCLKSGLDFEMLQKILLGKKGGLTFMLRVSINFLCIYTMPNSHYCSTCMLLYPHLMAKHCLKVGWKSKSEAWNLPTSGCKSMMEGPTIILGVFIILLNT